MTTKNKKNNSQQKGMVALPAIIVLSMIILTIGLSMSFSGFTQNNISLNNNKSKIAYYIAESGIKDAIIKISRNKNYSTTTPYTLPINNGNAQIEVSIISTPTEITSGQTKIQSIGTIKNNSKKIEMIVNITINGKITINSFVEL